MELDRPPCVSQGNAMNWCARMRHRERVEQHIDLPAEDWKGWKIRQHRLIGPGGMTFTADTLSACWRTWIKSGFGSGCIDRS